MARPGPRTPLALVTRVTRVAPVVAGLAALVALAALAGCSGGDDDASAPSDASVAAFCGGLEDAPGADATADDFHDYAVRLRETGTPAALAGDARSGFELFVDYLADLPDGDVAKVQDSDEPADVFSGDEAARVESFRSGYLEVCRAEDATPTPSATPSDELTAGPVPGLGDG